MLLSLVPSKNFTQGVCAIFTISFLISQAFLHVAAQCPSGKNGHVEHIKASLEPGWMPTVQSPGFPYNYPRNTNCSWTFSLPDDYEFLVAFKHFKVEPSKECRSDYVHVSFTNHSVPNWKRFCSIYSDNYIKTLRHERLHTHVFSERMTLMFISDGSIEFPGFEAEIRTVAPALVPPNHRDEYCVNHLNDTSGSFTSPKYPHPYPVSMSCTWNIAVPSGKKVLLWFTFFDLDNTLSKDGYCANDFVEIREGVWGRIGGIILGRFCSNGTIPPLVISPSNQMWVRFTSKNETSNNKHRGFAAKFKESSSGSSRFLPSFPCISLVVVFAGLTTWFS